MKKHETKSKPVDLSKVQVTSSETENGYTVVSDLFKSVSARLKNVTETETELFTVFINTIVETVNGFESKPVAPISIEKGLQFSLLNSVANKNGFFHQSERKGSKNFLPKTDKSTKPVDGHKFYSMLQNVNFEIVTKFGIVKTVRNTGLVLFPVVVNDLKETNARASYYKTNKKEDTLKETK